MFQYVSFIGPFSFSLLSLEVLAGPAKAAPIPEEREEMGPGMMWQWLLVPTSSRVLLRSLLHRGLHHLHAMECIYELVEYIGVWKHHDKADDNNMIQYMWSLIVLVQMVMEKVIKSQSPIFNIARTFQFNGASWKRERESADGTGWIYSIALQLFPFCEEAEPEAGQTWQADISLYEPCTACTA